VDAEQAPEEPRGADTAGERDEHGPPSGTVRWARPA
jgi:hypothetical protein